MNLNIAQKFLIFRDTTISRLKAQGLKAGGVAKGCGAVMNDRRKVTKMY